MQPHGQHAWRMCCLSDRPVSPTRQLIYHTRADDALQLLVDSDHCTRRPCRTGESCQRLCGFDDILSRPCTYVSEQYFCSEHFRRKSARHARLKIVSYTVALGARIYTARTEVSVLLVLPKVVVVSHAIEFLRYTTRLTTASWLRVCT